MLKLDYAASSGELLVEGTRSDYAHLAMSARELYASTEQQETMIAVAKTEESSAARLVLRKGDVPYRVFFSAGDIVFTIAPSLLESFLSFIDFPSDSELAKSSVDYHTHYDWVWDGGRTVSEDSLDTVFTIRTH